MVDAWFERQAAAELATPRMMAQRKFWAGVTDDYTTWQQLDRTQPYYDGDGVPHWSQAIDAALVLAAHGDGAEARTRLADFPTELKEALEREPANAVLWRGLSKMQALLGRKEDALQSARHAVALAMDRSASFFARSNLAAVYALTGEKEQAMQELSRLLSVPAPLGNDNVNVHFLRHDPRFVSLRGDPRFEALLNDPKNNEPLF